MSSNPALHKSYLLLCSLAVLLASLSHPSHRAWALPAQRMAATQARRPKPTATIYWFIRSSWRAQTDELVTQIEEHLRNDQRIRFTDSQSLLVPPKTAQQAFVRAEKLISKGKKALFELDLDAAASFFGQAVGLYQKHLAALIDSPFGTARLVDALSYQALAAFRNGDTDFLGTLLSKILALDPQWKPPKSFPSEMGDNLMSVRLEHDELGKAAIQITTHPNAGMVFLDGKKVGRAPVVTDMVAAGLHFVTIERRGFHSLTKVVQVMPPKQTDLDIVLPPVDKTLLSHLKDALSEMGSPLAGPGIRSTARRLGVGMLILGRIVLRGSEAALTLLIYDMKKGRVAGPAVTKTVDLQDMGDAPSRIARDLAAEMVPPMPRAAPAPRKRSAKGPSRLLLKWRQFRRWPGFWYTIAATTALVLAGTATGLAVGLSARSQQIRPGAARRILFCRTKQTPSQPNPLFPVSTMWRFP